MDKEVMKGLAFRDAVLRAKGFPDKPQWTRHEGDIPVSPVNVRWDGVVDPHMFEVGLPSKIILK
jgi:hypothetical protein